MTREHFLTTRLSPPPTHENIIERDRLLALLDVALQVRLTLICAPAGSGKTTLLSAWAERQAAGTIAWLSLDREDNDSLSLEKARFAVILYSGGATHARYHKRIEQAIALLRQALAERELQWRVE